MRGRWNFQWLETSQCYDHLRPTNLASVDLRNWGALSGGIRRSMRSRIPSTCGVLRPAGTIQYSQRRPVPLALGCVCGPPLARVPRRRQRFLFSPLGNNQPLFTRPQSETDITHLAEPLNVPEPISRGCWTRILLNTTARSLSLFLGADNLDTSLGRCRSAIWRITVPPGRIFGEQKISIDPVLGRIAVPPGTPPVNLRVTYHYGFSMPTGGDHTSEGKPLRSAAGLRR